MDINPKRAHLYSLNEFLELNSSNDKIEAVLQYALLAPSTHNTQPWKFKINGNSCDIVVDDSLLLKEADPEKRNLLISFGCLIETIVTAGEYFGIFDKVVLNKDLSQKKIATIFFNNLYNKDLHTKNTSERWLNAIVKRTTYRGLFNNKKIPVSVIRIFENNNISANVKINVYSDVNSKNKISEYTAKAVKEIADLKSFRTELSHWMIPNKSARRNGIPGYAYGFPDLVSIVTPWAVRNLNPSKVMAKKTENSFKSSQAVIVINTLHDDHIDWLNAGRVAQNIMLQLTKHNLKFSISVAAIQSKKYLALLRQSYFKNRYPQFIFAIGYSDSTQIPTPRMNLSSKLEK